jgi:endonuclease YncB( thermonuclease family)
VRIDYGDGRRTQDVFGRLLCIVSTPDGVNLNRRLIAAGWKWRKSE